MRDGVLALLLTVIVQVELLLGAEQVEGSATLQHLAFTVMTAAVALRRRVPLAAPLLIGLGMGAQTFIGEAPAASGYVALFIVLYSVATYAPTRRVALIGLLALLAGSAVYPFTIDDVSIGDEVVNLMIPTVVWVLARVAVERLDRAVEAERRRAEQARAADEGLAEERRRIARELHDTVAHGVTLMLLQSEVLRDRPTDAAALEVLQAAGRSCIDDLRRLLVLLRDDGADSSAPLGLAQLPSLVAAARAAGAQVELDAPPPPSWLPPSVQVAAFRVAQEALTNALRHAAGSPVRIRCSYGPDGVRVVVDDDGPVGRIPLQGGSGHGLTGVRERVSLHGGSVIAGPRANAVGWRVDVLLPVHTPAHV